MALDGAKLPTPNASGAPSMPCTIAARREGNTHNERPTGSTMSRNGHCVQSRSYNPMMPGDLAPATAIVTNLLGSLGNSGLGWGPAHHKVTIEERMAKSRSLATARDRTNANIGPNFGNKAGPKTGPNPGPKRRPIWIHFFASTTSRFTTHSS